MAEQWNYIDKMNTFIAYELQKLTPLEAVLYLHLFRLNNNSNPPRVEWFEVRNVELVGLMRKDPQGIRLLKKSLKEKGFIDFIPGKKGAPTKYSLLPFEGERKGVNKGGVKLPLKQEKGVKTPPENYPQNYPLNSPESLISCGVARGNKEKRKENITPLPPKGGGNDLFSTFWKAYPKKKAKKAAERAFLKLKPDEAQLGRMLKALERQKASSDWQKDEGQYIPYPATWLNGERWEDEAPPPPSHTLTMEEQEERRRQQEAEELEYIKRMEAKA